MILLQSAKSKKKKPPSIKTKTSPKHRWYQQMEIMVLIIKMSFISMMNERMKTYDYLPVVQAKVVCVLLLTT
jgi:hypothetical protein